MAALKRLDGFSLLETLVSLVIINIAIGIGGWTVLKVSMNVNSDQQFRMEKAMSSIISKTIYEKRYIDESLEEGGFVFKKKFEQFPLCQNLFNLNIEVHNKTGKLLTNKTFIFFIPNEK